MDCLTPKVYISHSLEIFSVCHSLCFSIATIRDTVKQTIRYFKNSGVNIIII